MQVSLFSSVLINRFHCIYIYILVVKWVLYMVSRNYIIVNPYVVMNIAAVNYLIYS